jgi:hypothetical protein
MLFLAVLTCLVFASCSKKTEIRRQMKKFTAATVVIPDNMDCINGLSVKKYVEKTKKAKLILYYDTLSCQSCSIHHIVQMEPLFDRSKKSGKFDVLIIFSPKSDECANVITDLVTLDYNFPIYVDTYGSFRDENKCIPLDIRFHAFLLDKNGHPIFVGNPLDSNPLNDLFEKALKKL